MRTLIVLLAVIAAGFGAWRYVFPGDEARIRAVLHRVAEAATAGAAEGSVARLSRAAAIRDELAPDVTVDAGAPVPRLSGREAVVGAAARMGGTVRNLEIRFPDISVAVGSDQQSAVAVVTAEAHFDGSDGRRFEARELEIDFKRVDGNWVIAAVSVISPIRRVP